MAASTRSKYINKKPEATLATTVQAHPTEAAYHLTPSLTSAVRQSWIPSVRLGQPSVGNRPHAIDLAAIICLLLISFVFGRIVPRSGIIGSFLARIIVK